MVTVSFFFLSFQATIYAQLKSAGNSSTPVTPGNVKNIASISSTITLNVSNETLKVRESTLKSAVVNLLNSVPNILKTSDSDQAVTKTKITNQRNNSTQNVEGREASNAIVAVEITKALRTIISTTNKPMQTGIVTLTETSASTPLYLS